MSAISKISGVSSRNSADDQDITFETALKKAYEKKQVMLNESDMKAFMTAMEKMQNKLPNQATGLVSPQKPEKPKPDANKYRAIAEKMADQQGNANGRVDTGQEQADVEKIIKQLMSAESNS